MKYFALLAFSLLLTVCSTAKTVKEEPFTVDWDSPKILAGEFEAQFDNIVNITGIRKVNVNVNYLPLEDVVCLEYRLDFITYYLYMDRDGRDAYLKALAQYKEDYDQRKLDTKGGKKTRRQYGNIDIYLVWQAFTYTVRARANTKVDFGYDIKTISKNRASFFTIYRRETFYANANSPQDRKIASNEPMYLTKAQADELAALLDQDFLNGLTPDNIIRKKDNTIDSY